MTFNRTALRGQADLNEAQETKKKKSGGFQSMGLSKAVYEGVKGMNFQVPTPIQRKAIPLLLQAVDVVAMARTGSGKTAAFVIPMLNRLGEHCTVVGIRGIVLEPTRELAVQVQSHIVQLGRRTNLKCTSITGGMSLDQQFAALATNPDIVVATPGRLLHVIEETSLQLTRAQALVMDEADRLFELGFQPQLVAIMRKIPDTCQRALFSATMPSILAEFAEAGLHNPAVVRLDSESKLSDKLQQSAFIVRTDEKVGALIYILKRLVKVPQAVSFMQKATVADTNSSRRKRLSGPVVADRQERNQWGQISQQQDQDIEDDEYRGRRVISGTQALIFVESKHHVEFLGTLLHEVYGMATVAVHGQMDQEARKLAVQRFSRKQASVMVVTDVAARGLDIPLLDCVINYSFPFTPKLFVHRVGRVARAGRSGVAYSIFTIDEMPYYIDLMHFLDRPLTAVVNSAGFGATPDDGCYGRIPDMDLQVDVDGVRRAIAERVEIRNLFRVVDRAHDKYSRTKKKASIDALREAHETEFRFESIPLHPLLVQQSVNDVKAVHDTLQSLRAFKAKETVLDMVHNTRVFVIHKKESAQQLLKDEAAKRLKAVELNAANPSPAAAATPAPRLSLAESMMYRAKQRKDVDQKVGKKREREDEDEVRPYFAEASAGDHLYKDREFFLEETRKETADSAYYSVKDVTLDINGETAEEMRNQRKVFAWNKKKNRFIKMNINEAKAQLKGTRNESGKAIDFKNKLDAYAKWTKASNIRIQDVGEPEDASAVNAAEAARRRKGKVDHPGEMDPQDEDTVDISDPNQGKKLRVGRKQKRFLKDGKVRNFDDMLAQKKVKEKQKAKMQKKVAKKGGKKKKK